MSYVALVLPEAPKTPESSSRSKVGPKVGFGGVPESRSKVGQKYTSSYTFDLLSGTLLLTYLNFPGFWVPLGGQGQHNTCLGSAETDPVRFKWGFGEGLLKDKFAFFEASKNPTPKRKELLAKRPFLVSKRALFETPFKLDRVSFSTPDCPQLYTIAIILQRKFSL